MAMGHVILKEFYVERQVPYFMDYARQFTDLPLLVTLRDARTRSCPTGSCAPRTSLPARSTLSGSRSCSTSAPASRPCRRIGRAPLASGDEGRWNLRLDGIEPGLSLLDRGGEAVAVDLPRFDVGETEGGGVMRRGVPTMRVGGQLVTTVFDLLLAQYGVVRPGLPGEWPAGYDDGEQPYTPAWQEDITSVDRHRRLGWRASSRATPRSRRVGR